MYMTVSSILCKATPFKPIGEFEGIMCFLKIFHFYSKFWFWNGGCRLLNYLVLFLLFLLLHLFFWVLNGRCFTGRFLCIMINTGSHFLVLWKAGHKLSTAKQKIHKINFATQCFELINGNMKAKSSYTTPFVTITPPPPPPSLSRASKYGTSHWIILTWLGMTRNNLRLRTWGQFVIFDTSLKKTHQKSYLASNVIASMLLIPIEWNIRFTVRTML